MTNLPCPCWGAIWQSLRITSGLTLALAVLMLVRGNEPLIALDPPKEALPADLALLSPHASGFVSIRVADLWNGEFGKQLRQGIGKTLDRTLRDAEAGFAVKLAEIDRLTVPVLFTEPPDKKPLSVWIIRTTRAFDRAKILKANAPKAEERQHHGKSYYVRSKFLAFAFIDEQSFMVGEEAGITKLLEPRPAKASAGPLGAALRQAASIPPHIVIAGEGPAMFKGIAKDLGIDHLLSPEALKPLLQFQSATVTLDLGQELRMDLLLTFAGTDQAKEGEKAAKAGLEKSRDLLVEATKRLPKEFQRAPALVRTFQDLQTALQNAPVRQEGENLTATLRMRLDVAKLSRDLLEAAQREDVAAQKPSNLKNLRMIGRAMLNYLDTYGRFPPSAIQSKDGKPLLSWRVAILPFVEQDQLYRQFKLTEPWDSPHNKQLLARMPKIYASMERDSKEPGTTFYQVFTGEGTVFSGPKSLGLTRITDGPANTLLVVEAAEAVPWTKPQDLPYAPDKPLPQLGGPSSDGFHALFCDGTVRLLRKGIDEKVLRALITANGGEAVDLQSSDLRQVLEKPPTTKKSAIQRADAAVRELGGYIVTEKTKEKRLVHEIRLSRQTQLSDADLGSLRQYLEPLPERVHLDLYECKQLTGAGLAHLKGLANISQLSLGGIPLSDKDLEPLVELTGLERLYLSSDRITDAGLVPLGKMTDLRHLGVYSKKVTEAGLIHLSGLIHLRRLNTSLYRLGDLGLSAMKDMRQLEELHVGGEGLTDAGLAHVQRMTKLRDLWLEGENVTDAGMASVAGLTELRKLTIYYMRKITDDGMASLKGLANLEELNLLGNRGVTDAGLVHVAALRKLKKLNLAGKYGDDALKPLAGLSELEQLEVRYTQVTDAGLEYLKGLAKLRELDVMHTKVTDAGLVHLKTLQNLERLNLQENAIADASLVHLSGLPNLRGLFLSRTKVTGAGFAGMRDLAKLGLLDLAETPFTDEGLANLKHLPSISFLWLRGTRITDDGLAQLKQLPNLSDLRIEKTAITDAGLVHLKAVPRINFVDLSHTKVTAGGVKAFQKELPKVRVIYHAPASSTR